MNTRENRWTKLGTEYLTGPVKLVEIADSNPITMGKIAEVIILEFPKRFIEYVWVGVSPSGRLEFRPLMNRTNRLLPIRFLPSPNQTVMRITSGGAILDEVIEEARRKCCANCDFYGLHILVKDGEIFVSELSKLLALKKRPVPA